jgi:hypothetical protein
MGILYYLQHVSQAESSRELWRARLAILARGLRGVLRLIYLMEGTAEKSATIPSARVG